MAISQLKLRGILTKAKALSTQAWLQTRNYANYDSSKFLVDVEVNTKYETTKNPEEWKYVERVLPITYVPEPIKKDKYPSGWKPPGDNFKNYPYFIPRTKNHMMPVYLRLLRRGIARHTIIRHIQGDIWQLEKDLRPFLQDQIKPRPVRLQVNEFAGKIVMNGDFVNAIKYWMSERNF